VFFKPSSNLAKNFRVCSVVLNPVRQRGYNGDIPRHVAFLWDDLVQRRGEIPPPTPHSPAPYWRFGSAENRLQAASDLQRDSQNRALAICRDDPLHIFNSKCEWIICLESMMVRLPSFFRSFTKVFGERIPEPFNSRGFPDLPLADNASIVRLQPWIAAVAGAKPRWIGDLARIIRLVLNEISHGADELRCS
jgi:hypothetical protein